MLHRTIAGIAALGLIASTITTGPAAEASNDPDDRPILFGLVTPGDSVSAQAEIDAFTQQAGRPPAFRMEFWTLEFDWPNAWGPAILTSHHDRGVTNVIEVFTNDLAALNTGHRDAALAGMAQSIADWANAEPGRRLLIAPLPEPNLVEHYGGAGPEAFKAGWHRIRDAILATGLDDSQVRFVFWMNGLTDTHFSNTTYADWYPGDDSADIIGFSRLNRNTNGWWGYSTVFTTHIEQLQETIGTHKPIMVMQTGTVGGSSAKDGWLTDMMTRLPKVTQVIGAIYVNRVWGSHDFRILQNGILRPPVKDHIGSWSHPDEVDWIFDGRMDDWVEWRREWLPWRTWGADRYATSTEISRAAYPNGTDSVYLAVGTNYPDSMVAGSAAASEHAPILLVEPDALPGVTRDELLRLAPTRVVIVGGNAAVSPAVADQVRALLPSAQIVRHSGATRYETAVEVSKAAFPDGADTVFVVTGENFPDALSATPPAVVADGPLLLVSGDTIPGAVAEELTRLGPDQIIIVGGLNAVSATVEQSLAAYASVVQRLDAPNRFATSAELSRHAFPNGADVAYIAVGTSFPDALTGGGTAGVAPGPMLLVEANSIPSEVADELARLKPKRIIVFGGPSVVSQKVLNALAAYITGG